MVLYAHLTVGAALLLLGLLIARRGVAHARLVRDLARLEPSPIRDTTPGLAMAHGRLQGDPLLHSPYQGRPCVYYFFRVLEPQPGKPARTLATGKQWTLARVEDATGSAAVDGRAALVASPRRHEDTLTGLQSIPEGLEDFFEQAGIDQKHLARFDRLIIHEYTLEPGDEVYVTGTLRVHDGEKAFYRRRRSPLIVSAERDIGYLQGLRHELFLYAALAPLALLGAIILGVLAFA